MFDNLDYNQYAKMRQRGLERQAQQLQQKQAALQAAQNKPKKSTLEEALGGLVTGIGERLSDIGNTAKNVGKTAFGWFNELVSGGQTDNTMKDDSKRRNDIAKKYGFNSYSEAINSNKVGDDFWNEIKGSNAQTKKTLDTQINDYRNSASGKLADVTNINTKEAMGQALNTYDTLLGALPLGGAYNALANAGGGVLSGIGDELKAAGREGRDFNWNQAKNNAIVGAGSGLAGAAGSALAGKAAAKAGGNALGKLLGSNVARGAAGGAAAGATGGALGAALNGGTLEDALLAAKEGAKAGGIGGGAMAGAMGLGGKALERFRNGKNGKATTIGTSEPVEAQIVQKNRIEAPNQRQLASAVEAVEPISTRRGIAITDLDAGEQPVNVRNGRPTESRGKYIDSVVRRSDANLPEAQLNPTDANDWYRNTLDDNQRSAIMDMQYNTKQINELLSGRGNNIPQDRAAELARKAQTVSDAIGQFRVDSPITVYRGMGADEFANLIFGEPSTESFKSTTFDKGTAENFAKNQGGYVAEYRINPGRYGADVSAVPGSSESEFLINKNIPYASVKRDVPNKRAYITIGEPNPNRKISIENALGQTQDVPVENLATNYRKSTIPARQYNEQAMQNMPEAEIATRPTTAAIEAPNQRQLASAVEAVEPISTRRGIAITDLDAGEQPVNVRNARQTLKNNTKNPSYYYYPEEQSIKPIEIDANGNYNVTDGINTIKTINGKVGTYNGSGDWKGAKVFDGQDGRGIPEGYKLMANENAAPSNEYVAIVNRSGEKALIKLPQASDYDYERVGLATGTTRESLANSGLIESANDYKPSKPYTKNGRKYIDSVVDRAKANLPEAEVPTLEQRFKRNYGDPLENIIANGDMGDNYQDIVDTLVASGATADDIARLKTEARGYAMDNNPLGETVKGNLPKLNLDEYKALKGITKREDINPEMLQYLRKDGRSFNDNSWSELFPDRIQDNGSGFVNIMPDEIAEFYENVAATQSPRAIYTPENIGGALVMNPELNQKIQQQMLATNYPTTKINIEKALAQTQDVPVENLATNYRKSTIPARQYNEQAMQNMPEAEIATRPTTAAMEAPEQRVATQERQVAANMSPADQARLERNITVLEQKQGNELLKQYGVLDKPTRRIVEDAPKVLANLQDSMGLTTPEEVQYAANHVTGGDGILAKATNQLASTATVDTRFEPNFIESLIEINGLNEADAKAVSKQIRGALNKLGERRKYVNGSDVLDTVKQLQGIARDYKGTSGTYHNATNADKFKVHVIEGVAQELEDRLWNAASPNIKQVITPELLDNMKQMYPGNTTWQNFVDNTVANARNGKELRAIQKPLVMGGYIVKGSKMSAGSFGETVANGAIQAGGAKGAAKNAAKVVADKVFNSPKQQQKRANKYQQQKQVAESQLRGETPVTANTSKLGAAKEKIANAGIVQGAKNLAGKAGNALAGATESLNNDSLAGINGIRVGKNYTPIEFDALGNQAAKFANKQMGSTTANAAQDRLESARTLANAQADYDNALADYQASEAQTNALTQQMQQSQSQLGRIEQAMQLALNAGDITAYSQLADLYKQAAEIEELKNPTKTASTKALSANQAKALTAQQQLDTLSQMTPDAGTVASNIPILSGIVNLTGGNEYANQASSLATTLGYLLSGANIKESEAQRIGQAYVPTAFDSEAVRKQKLERARQLIQSYMSDTGAIAQ